MKRSEHFEVQWRLNNERPWRCIGHKCASAEEADKCAKLLGINPDTGEELRIVHEVALVRRRVVKEVSGNG